MVSLRGKGNGNPAHALHPAHPTGVEGIGTTHYALDAGGRSPHRADRRGAPPLAASREAVTQAEEHRCAFQKQPTFSCHVQFCSRASSASSLFKVALRLS